MLGARVRRPDSAAAPPARQRSRSRRGRAPGAARRPCAQTRCQSYSSSRAARACASPPPRSPAPPAAQRLPGPSPARARPAAGGKQGVGRGQGGRRQAGQAAAGCSRLQQAGQAAAGCSRRQAGPGQAALSPRAPRPCPKPWPQPQCRARPRLGKHLDHDDFCGEAAPVNRLQHLQLGTLHVKAPEIYDRDAVPGGVRRWRCGSGPVGAAAATPLRSRAATRGPGARVCPHPRACPAGTAAARRGLLAAC